VASSSSANLAATSGKPSIVPGCVGNPMFSMSAGCEPSRMLSMFCCELDKSGKHGHDVDNVADSAHIHSPYCIVMTTIQMTETKVQTVPLRACSASVKVANSTAVAHSVCTVHPV